MDHLSPGTMVAVVIPGIISNKCWIKRSVCLVKQISLLETISTVVLLANVVVVAADLSRVFHAVDSAALQVTHRCTPAPCGMPAAPAALPTVCLNVSHCLKCTKMMLAQSFCSHDQNLLQMTHWSVAHQMIFHAEVFIGDSQKTRGEFKVREEFKTLPRLRGEFEILP